MDSTVFSWKQDGEPGRNRTFNQQIKSLLLCQLSYGPEVGRFPLARDVVRPTRARSTSIYLSSASAGQPGEPACLHGRWRARQDSNLRPLAPEAKALSS